MNLLLKEEIQINDLLELVANASKIDVIYIYQRV